MLGVSRPARAASRRTSLTRSRAISAGLDSRQMRVAIAIVVVAACGDNNVLPLPEVTDPVALVDPTIGTGGLGFAYGSCFVGGAAPHGVVNAGPHKNGTLFGTVNFQHYSGYFAGDDRIQGFSQLHLHGAGATD